TGGHAGALRVQGKRQSVQGQEERADRPPGRAQAAPAAARQARQVNAVVDHATTLGILAGGRALRLGGRDKAWLERDGTPQVLRWRNRFQGQVDEMLVSANQAHERYREYGIEVVSDAVPGAGPLAGLDALARACSTPWLLTLPVDLVDCNGR